MILIVIASCIAIPVIVGYLYGANQQWKPNYEIEHMFYKE